MVADEPVQRDLILKGILGVAEAQGEGLLQWPHAAASVHEPHLHQLAAPAKQIFWLTGMRDWKLSITLSMNQKKASVVICVYLH